MSSSVQQEEKAIETETKEQQLLEEENEDDEEESVVDPLGNRLMKIYLPCKQLTKLSRPKMGDVLFGKFVERVFESLRDVETFLAEQNHLALPWYQHLNPSDLKDTVGNFIRQAGLWHTTSYAANQEEVLSVEGQKVVASDLLEAFSLLDRVVGFFIESTRQKETEIKFPAEKRVPVLVVTGFLGSGKTTFLNYVLSAQHGLRIAVIENEFGEIGIDDSLVRQRFSEAEEIFEMNNGCICCTVRGDLIRILKKMMKIRDKFDFVLIETTGLADPAPIAQTFFANPMIGWTFRLDGILTVVDAHHIDQHLDEQKPEGVENESVEQLAFANIVLLNKLDLLGFVPPSSSSSSSEEKDWWSEAPESVQKLVAKVKGINSDCRIFPTIQSRVPLDQVLNQRSFDLEKVMAQEPQFLEDESHQHDTSVSSVGIEVEGEMDQEKLSVWLRTTLMTKGVDIFRFKGILAVKGISEKFVFQGVHMLLDSEALGQWAPDEKKVSRAVFIGRNLDRRELTDGLISCLA